MEDAQASKREGRGEKRKENKDEGPSKKPKAFVAVRGKGLLSYPMSYKDGPQRPKSDKFCRFHNDYGHTTEKCRHLKNEIERLVQNGFAGINMLKKARGTGPYQKYKAGQNISPEPPIKEIPRSSTNGKAEVSNPPRKGVITMIAGGPAGTDSQRVRKARYENLMGQHKRGDGRRTR
ncbi:UNVERIFIED_CONTAM: hypothetical protein Slati_1350600 [Sesamum latifolium]|uniref:Reverse transcriptase domain-containing protein n=1 Tax=Sesamum latifolium TaxID=2727402 RepID=A0AAW2XJ56_9LAMI